jgi:cytochrome c
MKISHKFLAGFAVFEFACALIHPFGRVKTQSSPAPLFANTDALDPVVRIVNRSCRNCHSEQTHWPWYSYIAPMSWMIEKDVHDARLHMNLSRWQEYPADKQVEILARLGSEVRNHRMPLPRYQSLHPEAALSDADIRQLYDWTRKQRRRLTAPPLTPGHLDIP